MPLFTLKPFVWCQPQPAMGLYAAPIPPATARPTPRFHCSRPLLAAASCNASELGGVASHSCHLKPARRFNPSVPTKTICSLRRLILQCDDTCLPTKHGVAVSPGDIRHARCNPNVLFRKIQHTATTIAATRSSKTHNPTSLLRYGRKEPSSPGYGLMPPRSAMPSATALLGATLCKMPADLQLSCK